MLSSSAKIIFNNHYYNNNNNNKRNTAKNKMSKNDLNLAQFQPMQREPYEEVKLEEDGSLFVFGYGSIIWKFDIPSVTPVKTVRCKAFGYERRFYQGSTDHRGTVGFPGRTVTLVKSDYDDDSSSSSSSKKNAESESSYVSGVAYLIQKEDVAVVLENLEFREKQYDLRVQLEIYSDEDDYESRSNNNNLISTRAVCWIATSNTKKNINWIGEQTEDEIAKVIANAKGPSGPNYEYLFNLCEAMRKFNIEDAHLYELEKKVKAFLV